MAFIKIFGLWLSGKDGKGHPCYISVSRGNKYKFNVITHSRVFFENPTLCLSENPNRHNNRKDYKKPSRVSISRWDDKKEFSRIKLKYWKFSKKDKALIKKIKH